MNITVETITPEIAHEWLEKYNRRNRSLAQSHVKKLAREMELGRFKPNGDAIRFDSNGLLIDGQHRLWACVQSKVPFQSIVVRNLPPEVFEDIDQIKPRGGGCVLSILGEKNTCALSSALTNVASYLSGRIGKRPAYTNADVKSLLVQYPGVRDSVQRCIKKTKGLISPSILSAMHYLFSQKDADLAEVFIEKLTTGKNMEEGEPVYVLRERLMANSMSHAKLSNPYLMAIIIKAWNYTRSGTKLKCLRFSDAECFPIIE